MQCQRAFIIHGYLSHPQEAWLPWLKHQLEQQGYAVALPDMPEPTKPIVKVWRDFISALVGEPDDRTTLVGHSLGCQGVLRYLESMGRLGKKVKKTVLVAGSYPTAALADRFDSHDESDKILLPWYRDSVDGAEIKKAAGNCTVILSDNDPYIPLEPTRTNFIAALGAKVIVDAGRGHFNEDDGLLELPSVLSAVLE